MGTGGLILLYTGLLASFGYLWLQKDKYFTNVGSFSEEFFVSQYPLGERAKLSPFLISVAFLTPLLVFKMPMIAWTIFCLSSIGLLGFWLYRVIRKESSDAIRGVPRYLLTQFPVEYLLLFLIAFGAMQLL